jgi:hypothetical protein
MKNEMNMNIYTILAEFEDAIKSQSGANLKDWIKRYPEHKYDLEKFFLLSITEQDTEEPPESDYDAFENKYRYVAARIMQEAWELIADAQTPDIQKASSEQTPRESKSKPASFKELDIFSQIRALNLSPEQIAKDLRIGYSLLVKLNRRMINISSIPENFLKSLAEKINMSAGDISMLISDSNKPVKEAFYALAPPLSFSSLTNIINTGRQQIFIEAVMQCPDMEESDRKYWLEQSKDE